MAKREDYDIEALLAEVDRTLSGRSSRPSARRPADPVDPRSAVDPRPAVEPHSPGGWRDEVARRTRNATVSAALAAAVIFALFAVIPFLGSVSGAAGAALATFVVVLLLPGRR